MSGCRLAALIDSMTGPGKDAIPAFNNKTAVGRTMTDAEPRD